MVLKGVRRLDVRFKIKFGVLERLNGFLKLKNVLRQNAWM